MNDTDTTTPPTPKRKRKSATPRAPRVKDPGIAAIDAEAKAKRAEYRKGKASGAVFNRIREKFLPRLTQSDTDKLAEVLNAVSTPPLPMKDA